jgi:hypothetical protein
MHWKAVLIGSLAVCGTLSVAFYFWMRVEGVDRAHTHDIWAIGMLCCFGSFALRRWWSNAFK